MTKIINFQLKLQLEYLNFIIVKKLGNTVRQKIIFGGQKYCHC